MSDPFNPENLINDYLDDQLSDEERAKVEGRLASDPALRQLKDQLARQAAELARLPKFEMRAGFVDDLLKDDKTETAFFDLMPESHSVNVRYENSSRLGWAVSAIASLAALLLITLSVQKLPTDQVETALKEQSSSKREMVSSDRGLESKDGELPTGALKDAKVRTELNAGLDHFLGGVAEFEVEDREDKVFQKEPYHETPALSQDIQSRSLAKSKGGVVQANRFKAPSEATAPMVVREQSAEARDSISQKLMQLELRSAAKKIAVENENGVIPKSKFQSTTPKMMEALVDRGRKNEKFDFAREPKSNQLADIEMADESDAEMGEELRFLQEQDRSKFFRLGETVDQVVAVDFRAERLEIVETLKQSLTRNSIAFGEQVEMLSKQQSLGGGGGGGRGGGGLGGGGLGRKLLSGNVQDSIGFFAEFAKRKDNQSLALMVTTTPEQMNNFVLDLKKQAAKVDSFAFSELERTRLRAFSKQIAGASAEQILGDALNSRARVGRIADADDRDDKTTESLKRRFQGIALPVPSSFGALAEKSNRAEEADADSTLSWQDREAVLAPKNYFLIVRAIQDTADQSESQRDAAPASESEPLRPNKK